jgi:hypothetical protein
MIMSSCKRNRNVPLGEEDEMAGRLLMRQKELLSGNVMELVKNDDNGSGTGRCK